MKIKKMPTFITVYKGKRDARRKVFVKRNSKFHTGFTADIEKQFDEYVTKSCQQLAIQTASERKRLSLCCEEYKRQRSLPSNDDCTETARRAAERKLLEDEIISLNSSIMTKITYTTQSIFRAMKVYNSQLVAYYTGLSTGLNVDQNGIVELSIDSSPFNHLLVDWHKERDTADKIIKLIEGGVEDEE